MPMTSRCITTRPNLRCESADCNPVPVSGDDHGFEVPSLFDEVVWWDSEEAGGDGLRLESALERGQVSVAAVLDQEFLYGGARGYGTDGREWATPEMVQRHRRTRLGGPRCVS